MPDEVTPEESQDGIWLDGKMWTVEDLTFREQREVRKIVRELTGDPNHGLLAEDCDFVPAVITVIKRRDSPEFSLAQAEEMTIAQLAPPERNGSDPQPRATEE